MTGGKPIVDAYIAVLRPSALLESLPESSEPRLRIRVVLGEACQDADAWHLCRLLRACRERPRNRRASRAYPYAAHARANASTCSLGKEPDVTSSRVCLPSSSLTNESSQYVCGAFVKAILTVSCSRKSVTDN